jgi:TonB-dependent SusC/RagA subfamily outer membrane receptor
MNLTAAGTVRDFHPVPSSGQTGFEKRSALFAPTLTRSKLVKRYSENASPRRNNFLSSAFYLPLYAGMCGLAGINTGILLSNFLSKFREYPTQHPCYLMCRHPYVLLLLSLLYGGINLSAQTDYFQQYNEKLAGLRFEKVYLHTDRSIYSAGEELWFKIYLLDGKSHTPLAGANNVYVDLVDAGGKTVIRKPYFVENGTADGSFTINDSLGTGVYTLYAYTNYLRNFGIGTFFKKEITLSRIEITGAGQVIAQEADTIPERVVEEKGIALRFMPEGGYLPENLYHKLAFRISGPGGKGINLRGVIKDQNGSIKDSLIATFRGMGVLSFRAEPGERYYALLNEFPADTFVLPQPADVPQFQYMGHKDSIVEFRFRDGGRHRGSQFYIVVKARGEILFYVPKKFNTSESIVKLHRRVFSPGINEVVLMDGNFVPLSERLVFMPGAAHAPITLSTPKEIYSTREKTRVTFRLDDVEDRAAGGSFSLAVLNLEQAGLKDIPDGNILSYLELESEIRGGIEDPGYYFSHPYDSVKEQLDLLLLTQGWRKYIWDKAFTDSLTEMNYTREAGLTIGGRAQRLLKNTGVENGNIILMIPQEFILAETQTDSNGYFYFDRMVLYDSTKIVVQSRNSNNKANTRLVDAGLIYEPPPLFPPVPKEVNLTELRNYNRNAYSRYVSNSYYNFDNSTILIDEVTVVHKKKEEDDGHFRMYSQASSVIDVEEELVGGYSDLLLFLQGRVAGLLIMGDRVSIRGAQGSPLFILDGFEIDMEMARTIPLEQVDKIEVLKDAANTAVFGLRGGNGVIAIYTRRGELDYSAYPLLDVIAKSIEGFGRSKQFYMPDYSTPLKDPSRIDHRATLYWEPNLVPDATGTASLEYYNSDDTGKVVIITEGILNNGKAGVSTASYSVRRD